MALQAEAFEAEASWLEWLRAQTCTGLEREGCARRKSVSRHFGLRPWGEVRLICCTALPSTVAILAQGTDWADASSQAFFASETAFRQGAARSALTKSCTHLRGQSSFPLCGRARAAKRANSRIRQSQTITGLCDRGASCAISNGHLDQSFDDHLDLRPGGLMCHTAAVRREAH